MDYEVMMNGNVRIGMYAPDFEAVSTMGDICLNDYKGKWVVLFSHPGDFTPVCTTEIIAFAKADTYFRKRNTCLVGLSVDSNASHLAWLYDIYCRTGIKVPFPIIADRNGTIARKYGMISNDISNTETVRNVFIIDDKGIVRAILVYPMNVGRCIPEILRLLEALQVAECNKASTPANWCPNEPIIQGSPKTFNELQERLQSIQKEQNGFNWYLSFKEQSQCCKAEFEEKETKKLEEKN
ncbi:MAG: peroxiredoxin [Clostridia bacterium]|nr:peroxiredoxin [Clostridia bacterium]